ncbi:DUF4215 domain-containing protein [Myxococcota bacterium]|nr:DUF4215 domain-containing protein [Myxococcota bacterium]MBU1379385.1 DUF4215 domain-containing protein [Myxococcota bacterium]MBU1496787.1 DUF4215 domain-containing protein [Myxococcota bacterium]
MKKFIIIALASTVLLNFSCTKKLGLVQCGDQDLYCPEGSMCIQDIGGDYICTNSGCGNLLLEPNPNNPQLNEECDRGPQNSNEKDSICRVDCKLQDCGDGITDDNSVAGTGRTDEECDEGDLNSTPDSPIQDRCRQFRNPDYPRLQSDIDQCNTRFVQGDIDELGLDACIYNAEEDVSANTENLPLHICRNPFCGDGIQDTGEQCDQGEPGNILIKDGLGTNGLESSTCTINCDVATCGDGIINTSVAEDATGTALEECDEDNAGGNKNEDQPDTCRYNCKNPACGDGVLDVLSSTGPTGGAEECDDPAGNADDPDKCRLNCSLPSCGDGIIDVTSGTGPNGGSEECDDGEGVNQTARNACRTNCQLPYCGDGIVDDGPDFGEECDTGALGLDDGCDDNCQIVAGWSCDEVTEISPSICNPGCGNGIVSGIELTAGRCDDGDQIDGDGCSSTCMQEPGWVCTSNPPGSTSVCLPICGDGIIVQGEQCDQGSGNQANGDGCSANCQEEPGWDCTGTPSTCSPVCGDGVILGGEQCDQGSANVTPNDGCNASCQIESGWICNGAPSTCTAICGDGQIVATEQCDQGGGNNTPLDGCNALCLVETGWTCNGTPSVCSPTCGDGLILGTEQCDQGSGNVAPNDGCNGSCQEETGWDCVGAPSNCTPICHDGLIRGTESNVNRCDIGVGNTPACIECVVQNGWQCTNDEPSVCSTICGDNLALGAEPCDGTDVRGQDCTDHGFVNIGNLQCNGCSSFSLTGCIAVCGNGVIEPANGIAPAEACDQGGGNQANGDGCNASCQVEPGWYCSGTPSVCTNTCGDNVAAGGEPCDGTDLRGQDCTDHGFVNPGSLSCTACNWNLSGCNPVCGNGTIEPGETCDQGGGNVTPGDGCNASCQIEAGWYCAGTPSVCTTSCGDGIRAGTEVCDDMDLNGQDCTDHGYASVGSLACNAGCSAFVTTGCTAVCHNNVTEPGETCDDGPANSGDGDGCSALCQIEVGWDCNTLDQPTTCTEHCGDGIIVGSETCDGTNLDGQTCNDHGYSDPAGLDCNSSCDAFDTSSCNSDCRDGNVEPGEACDDGDSDNNNGCNNSCIVNSGWNCTGNPSVCTTTCGDDILAGSEVCDTNQLNGQDCTDYGFTNPAGLACNGLCSGYITGGCSAACGNGTIEPGELCDQGGGNTANGDGCDSNCQPESGWTCSGTPSVCTTTCGDGIRAGTEQCDGAQFGTATCIDYGYVNPGSLTCNACVIETSSCVAVCHNNVTEPGETCDDGPANSGDGDGCSAACQVETGWDCDIAAIPTTCVEHCGDNLVVGTETCDGTDLDGQDCTDHGFSDASGLACNTDCDGYITTGCSPTCNDSILEPGEGCDDGPAGTGPGDGCDASCQVESGWNCDNSSMPSVCTTVCGDGTIINPPEECDQGSGNVANGDGCDSNCLIETGWLCSGTPSACIPDCGDGMLIGGETCDGTLLNGQDCTNFGFADTAGLACNGACDGYDVAGCNAVCGNGVIEPTNGTDPAEGCDQGSGNVAPGDGCDGSCQVEAGWTCDNTTPPSVCSCNDNTACANGYECDPLPGTGLCVPMVTDTCPGETITGSIADTTIRNTSKVDAWSGTAGPGPDMFFNIYLNAGEFIVAKLYPNAWDAVLVLMTDGCDPTADIIEVSDWAGSTAGKDGELIHFVATTSGTYVLAIDGYTAGATGSFTLSVETGVAVTPETSSLLVINEIGIRIAGDEYVEFYNADSSDFNLNNCRLITNETTFIINDDVIVPASGYVTVGYTRNANDINFDMVSWAWAGGDDDRINASGFVTISTPTADASIIDTVDFADNSGGWPNNDGTYSTLSFEQSFLSSPTIKTDNDSGANWCRRTTPNGTGGEGTPDEVNNCP